jgi:hypothetical protein
MSERIKTIESLTVADLRATAIWKYGNIDSAGETIILPVRAASVKSLTGKVVGTTAVLANGASVWALIGNIDVDNPRFTFHFLTISIESNGKWFSLARYHDHDHPIRGPDALARFLGLKVDDVFPITLDIRRFVAGNLSSLTFRVEKEPNEKFTRAEIIAMAVP